MDHAEPCLIGGNQCPKWGRAIAEQVAEVAGSAQSDMDRRRNHSSFSIEALVSPGQHIFHGMVSQEKASNQAFGGLIEIPLFTFSKRRPGAAVPVEDGGHTRIEDLEALVRSKILVVVHSPAMLSESCVGSTNSDSQFR